jgi:hypothetical protein
MEATRNQPAQRCGATNRQGNPCGKPAGWGTDHNGTGHCRLHGGASPNGRKHAQAQQAVAAVVTYGLAREIDPHQALLEELHRTAGHVAWLQIKVAELEAEHVVVLVEDSQRTTEDMLVVHVRNHPEAPAVVRRHLTALDGGLAA